MLKYFRSGFGPETLVFHVNVAEDGHIPPQSVLCWNSLTPAPFERSTSQILSSTFALNEISAEEFKKEIQDWADTTLVCDANREENVIAVMDCITDRDGQSRLTKAIEHYKDRSSTDATVRKMSACLKQ